MAVDMYQRPAMNTFRTKCFFLLLRIEQNFEFSRFKNHVREMSFDCNVENPAHFQLEVGRNRALFKQFHTETIWNIWVSAHRNTYAFFLGFATVNFVINDIYFVYSSDQQQRIPHPFSHLSLPPPSDGLIDTIAMSPNVGVLQPKQHQQFMPPTSQHKYAHMHNVSHLWTHFFDSHLNSTLS